MPLDSAVLIRDAREGDASAIAEAERQIAKLPGRLASRPHELKDEAFREKIAALSGSETGRYVVVECQGEVVGHAILEPFKLEVTAHAVDLTIAVNEGHQGQGHGKALLRHLLDWATRNPKIERVMLNVRSSNTAAISLYEKLGFVVEGIRVKQIKLAPGSYLDNIASKRSPPQAAGSRDGDW